MIAVVASFLEGCRLYPPGAATFALVDSYFFVVQLIALLHNAVQTARTEPLR
jgi:hypothetical protein